MKRLIRKNHVEIRDEFLVHTSPLYNPMGPGQENEFNDEKSYSHWFNENTMKGIEERKYKRLKNNSI